MAELFFPYLNFDSGAFILMGDTNVIDLPVFIICNSNFSVPIAPNIYYCTLPHYFGWQPCLISRGIQPILIRYGLN